MCWNKGRLCWKIAKLFYFCHLKKLVRPETFGPYYVTDTYSIKIFDRFCGACHIYWPLRKHLGAAVFERNLCRCTERGHTNLSVKTERKQQTWYQELWVLLHAPYEYLFPQVARKLRWKQPSALLNRADKIQRLMPTSLCLLPVHVATKQSKGSWRYIERCWDKQINFLCFVFVREPVYTAFGKSYIFVCKENIRFCVDCRWYYLSSSSLSGDSQATHMLAIFIRPYSSV